MTKFLFHAFLLNVLTMLEIVLNIFLMLSDNDIIPVLI